MNSYSLTHLCDDVLVQDLKGMLARERGATAMLLAHMAEVDVRRLYVPEGFSSMFTYCVGELRLSEDAAWRRIQAARAGRRHPLLFRALANGSLHLTAVVLIAPHLTSENITELMNATTRRSRTEIQTWLATRFPQASPMPSMTSIRPVSTPRAPVRENDGAPTIFDQPAPEHVNSTTPVAGEGHSSERIDAAETRAVDAIPTEVDVDLRRSRESQVEASPRPSFRVQVTIPESTHDKLRHAQALLSHAVDPRDVAQLLDRALDALIEKYEKRRFGAAPRSA